MKAMKQQFPLSQLPMGEKAIIVGFSSPHGIITQRMEEMGILPGEEVEYVQRAPLGDPMEIQIKGYMLSLRSDEAELVTVRSKK